MNLLSKTGFLLTSMSVASPAFAVGDCKAVVKHAGTDTDDGVATVSVRVYATKVNTGRLVYYSIQGDVLTETRLSDRMPPIRNKSIFYQQANTRIDEGEEYAEDEITINSVTGTPISKPLVKLISVDNCFTE